jgi:hypothetical protein
MYFVWVSPIDKKLWCLCAFSLRPSAALSLQFYPGQFDASSAFSQYLRLSASWSSVAASCFLKMIAIWTRLCLLDGLSWRSAAMSSTLYCAFFSLRRASALASASVLMRFCLVFCLCAFFSDTCLLGQLGLTSCQPWEEHRLLQLQPPLIRSTLVRSSTFFWANDFK